MTTTTEIVAYTPTKAALAGLRNKYEKAVYEVTTTQGMADAKAAKKELATHRITLEEARKKEKAESLAYGRFVDSEAKTIADKLAALEDPITAQIEVETKRVEREREAAIKAEQDRLAAEERARKEAEEKRLAEERAKLAVEREALEKAQAAQRETEEKARREREEADRQARAKIEAEERAARQRIAEAEAKARAERQVEEDRLRAEREKIDVARHEEEDRQRKVREQKEAAEREEKRKATELLDAQGVLDSFVKRFGHLKQFANVVKAIEALKVPA
jgi:hypothetical protein